MIFDPIFPSWLIILPLALATAVLLWMESERKLRFRTLRLVAVVLMMIALAAIFLRPQINSNESGAALLLTPGYRAEIIDSLVAEHPDLQIMHSPGTEPYKNSRPLPSYYDVRDIEGSIQFVCGEGLPRHALDLLNQRNFKFIPGDSPHGIVELSVPDQIVVNRRSSIEGKFQNSSGATSIILVGPGGKEDSISVKDGMTPFELSFTPRQKGNVLYSLVITDSLGNEDEDQLPLVASELSPLKVLVIVSFPTFETTFLKNFLAGKSNQLVIRSQLSKHNFSYEFVNHEPVRFSTVTKSVLDDFDLVIADGATIQKLSKGEAASLKESINDGLGLLSLYESAPREGAGFYPFRTVALKGDTTTIKTGLKRITLPVLPFRIDQETPLQKVLANESGVLAGYTFSGIGKIGFQLLRETYSLMLSGDTISYANIWSPLIERIARTARDGSSIVITSPFPYYTDEPMHIRLMSAHESPLLMADSIRVPLREDVQLDNVWHTTVWPSTKGWHSLQINDKKLEFFVADTDDWHSLSIANQMEANSLALQKVNKPTVKPSERRKISPLVFYAAFLLSAGFLWLAPKL